MEGDMDIVDPLIEEYLGKLVASPDPIEAEMRRLADELEGFPLAGPVVGAFLQQLALMVGARRIFELGSGFGYSAFWFARGLPAGGTVTLTDYSRDHLDRAKEYLGRAGLLDRCRIETPGDGLAALERQEPGLDVIFFDQEKADYPRALPLAISKLRPGGLIVADNVLWGGAVARGETDPSTAGLREFLRLIHSSEGLVSSVVPLRDGVSISWKR
jgi:predicted O-methyltransferase YrrM